MPKESDEREIDGLKFISYQLDPLELYPLAPRIIKCLAPVLPFVASLGGGLDAKAIEKLFAQDASKLAPILTAFAEGLADEKNAKLPLELLKRTVVELPNDDEEKPPTRQSLTNTKEINAVFRGRFFTMLKAMWFALGVNLSDFSPGGSGETPSKG